MPEQSEERLSFLQHKDHREVQKIAKELGLKQNGSTKDLISRILATQGQEQTGDAVAEALDASETNTISTQNPRHEPAAVIRPEMPPPAAPSRTASASSECQPLPAAASPRRSGGALPRTRTVDQASTRELHPSEASSPLRASGGLFPMLPSSPDDALQRTPTTDQASRQSQPIKSSSLLSPIHYSSRPTQPDKSDTHVYKALMVSMSGRRSTDAKHIRTQELVEKLEKQMMRTNPKNGDGTFLDEQLLWSLSPPDFIFNITGTADPKPGAPPHDAIEKFKQDWPEKWYYKRLKDYIAQVMFGIAAEHKSCWMMDGGTNAGIMALLGAMHKNHFYKALHSANDFPLIGFSDLSTLDKHDSFPDFPQFSDGRFALLENAFENSQKRYKPDAHHTHHVHVHSSGLKCGTGTGNPHEHHFLLQFSRHLAQRFTQCPMVRRRGIISAFHDMFVTPLFSCPRCCWWRHWIFEKHRERAASRGEFAHQTHCL
jgi:hypothetical protein